ncbi:LPS export ABC transporter periplasmic protein LptC [Ottowia oryzae]|uniref:LPS export ABC transporter periplasmic protein LptC n=1 Tax=Ottowia oryzae TaxID=2109914 RepID=A0A2S0MCJ2_9BURK|nr:LPS export ABC transporter periplasmic protein LptC [Ottowia oryzae]AVO33578.1 LPS export ABC transporter periplasmic protein LptC [Ottowia oryzae]
MSESRLARIGRDQLSTWLPALMMMLFALGTWWLVRSAPKFPTDGAAAVVSKEPDYFMNQFRVRDFDATGRLTSDLTGVEGHHFPVTDTLEVKDPHMRSVDDDGRVTVATALRGVSNGDGSEIQLFGNAVIVREATKRPDGTAVPRMEFRGEYLHAFVNEDRVSSDKPVELLRGADRFVGDQLDYDNRTGVAVLKGRVRGMLQPAK